ncbi:TspO/MBR related protein [Ancylomarina subtilis]|uniref:TspO/MBR related protein n=1 Tax=Ancylomarina subtilis TaxID=1639035 RepID=A0A4Q7VHD5_9BACT|nr:TspO/MBR family protein [Ancylomarina subtilis]RZT95489.1 TspO/MBR related protein [Ancylomarina subtilis]
MNKKLTLFLILNFTALFIAGIFTGDGVPSNWYQHLNKAPWTPPGWLFGIAWTFIMICFAYYMSYLFQSTKKTQKIIILYSLQWLLNSLWAPVYFYYHNILGGLMIIISLLLLIIFFFVYYKQALGFKSILIVPYVIWMFIATSLNLYTFLYN